MATPDTLVVVVWSDAWCEATDQVTIHSATITHKPLTVTTIGWLLVEDAVGVSVANEKLDGEYRGRTFIPRAMIVSVTPYKLSKPKAGKVNPPTSVV